MHEASPSEVVAAARQHVDYEAAAQALYQSEYPVFDEDALQWEDCDDIYRDRARFQVRAIVNAALGIEGEEGT